MKHISTALLTVIVLLICNPCFSQLTFSGKVIDAKTNEPLAARIKISNDTGKVYNSYYSKLPGFFTQEDGSFSVSIPNGRYIVEVFHGIDYVSQKFDLTLNDNTDTTINLTRWVNLKQKGWYNGDGHDHLYTDIREDTAMLGLVRKICVAQGVDFMCTAQGWAGYNDSNWRRGYAKFTDDKFYLHYGSEMPKYRTGHTWWLGQYATKGMFDAVMDTIYENHYFQSDSGTTWTFKDLPFPNTPDFEMVQRLKTEQHALAIAAHPTSWWMQERGKMNKYVTNVACNLSFGLLSGKVWDGLVAMGYDHDHYFYQNLWFNVLNLGYRMPAFSELDGGLGKDDKFYYGSMRTYFHVDGQLSIEKIVDAAKRGRSFLTSGPILFSDIDRRYSIGDVIAADSRKHVLNIDAYASGDGNDTLSYVIVFRNGKPFKTWDIRNQHKRRFTTTLTLNENDNSWYIVKVYGRRAWKDPKYIDVMEVCKKEISVEPHEGEFDVAFTNPFYFRKKNEIEPTALISTVNLVLRDSLNNTKSFRGSVDVFVAGKKIKSIPVNGDSIIFRMPVNAIININVKGYRSVSKNLYLDYIPHRNLIEELASGRWREKYDKQFNPGEVPFEAFNFEKTRSVLKEVVLPIELQAAR